MAAFHRESGPSLRTRPRHESFHVTFTLALQSSGEVKQPLSLEHIRRAILLGCARKFMATINTGVCAPITSLHYFSAIIEEVVEAAIPESYWEPLRHKVARMEKQWQQTATVRP